MTPQGQNGQGLASETLGNNHNIWEVYKGKYYSEVARKPRLRDGVEKKLLDLHTTT